MMRIVIAVVVVLALAIGGNSYTKSRQEARAADQLAEKKRQDDLRVQLEEAKAKQVAAEEKLAQLEAERNQPQAAQPVSDSSSQSLKTAIQEQMQSPEEARKADLEEQARKAVTGILKDPDSAKFRITKVGLNVTSLNGQKFDHVCGEVNAKNSFGGFTGYSRFYWDGKITAVADNDLWKIVGESLWSNWCK